MNKYPLMASSFNIFKNSWRVIDINSVIAMKK
jgi:hypothetical protein